MRWYCLILFAFLQFPHWLIVSRVFSPLPKLFLLICFLLHVHFCCFFAFLVSLCFFSFASMAVCFVDLLLFASFFSFLLAFSGVLVSYCASRLVLLPPLLPISSYFLASFIFFLPSCFSKLLLSGIISLRCRSSCCFLAFLLCLRVAPSRIPKRPCIHCGCMHNNCFTTCPF